MSIEVILKNTEDSFIFSKTHRYSNINLFIASIFNLQIWLESNKNKFKDINLYQVIFKWLEKLHQNKVIDLYEGDVARQLFYIYPTHEMWKAQSSEYKLLLPLYNENTVA